MDIFLVRHGEVDHLDRTHKNPALYHLGNPMNNPNLTKKGLLQAKKLAKKLSKYKFDRIYVSDYARTRQTLEQVKKYQKKSKITIMPELREISTEVLGGKNLRRPMTAKIISFDKKRMNYSFDKILKENKSNSKVLVIAHGNVISYFISRFIKVPHKKMWPLMIWPTSVTEIKTNKKGAIIVQIGDVSHLKDHEIEKMNYRDFDGVSTPFIKPKEIK